MEAAGDEGRRGALVRGRSDEGLDYQRAAAKAERCDAVVAVVDPKVLESGGKGFFRRKNIFFNFFSEKSSMVWSSLLKGKKGFLHFRLAGE